MSNLLSFLKRWWPTIMTAAMALWGAFSPAIQAYIMAHPQVAAVVAALYAVFQHLMPSPVTGGNAVRLIKP